jgi:hypothetical protein
MQVILEICERGLTHPFQHSAGMVGEQVWQPLLVAAFGTAVLYLSAAASLCKRQPPVIIRSSDSIETSAELLRLAISDKWLPQIECAHC